MMNRKRFRLVWFCSVCCCCVSIEYMKFVKKMMLKSSMFL